MEIKRAPDTFALSPMQQGMLFHHLQEQNSGVDVEQLVVHLPEIVDPIRMLTAWQWLVDRHEILRVRFLWEGEDQPLQQVTPKVAVPVVQQDASGIPEPARKEYLRSFLEADRTIGLRLDLAPLLRITLIEWSHSSFSLVWTFHHALLDGRSYPILLREVFEAYEELEIGGIATRAEPPPYRRYIEWLGQQEFFAGELFWKERLKGFRATTPLVVASQENNDQQTFRQGVAWQGLDSATTDRLRELAGANDVTVNSLVMGAWAILLHRYSGEEDIVFGAVRACRKSSIPAADETVGIFINTVPVRLAIRDDDSALSIFKTARRTWDETRPYEHMPLTRVKAVSQIPAGQSLFDTLVVFENIRLDKVMRSLGGAWAHREVELHELTNFPLTLAAYDGEELTFKIEFDRQRFSEQTAQRLVGHLRELLEGVAANPNTLVLDLPLLSETERRELIEQVDRRELRTEKLITLHQGFEAKVTQNPDAVALVCDGKSLSYRQANSMANRLAGRLVEGGVRPGALVGLFMDRSSDLVISILAILKAGGAYLPIDLAYPKDRVAFMLEDSRAPVILTHRELVDRLPAITATILFVDEILSILPQDEDEPNLKPLANLDSLAYVIYTSGTTGKPKGTEITHRNVARLFAATEHWFEFNEKDVWTLFHSSAFDFSVWEIWGALLYGGRVVVVPFALSRSPEGFYELLVREQVTVLNQTPSAFRQLMQAEESVGQKGLALRYVIFGGEALELQSLRPWFERHGDQKPQLVNMYGITETTVHVTYRPLSKNDLGFGSVIGIPIPDLQIYVLDKQGRLVPVGVAGEMYVSGAGVARGYLRREELTKERFLSNPFSAEPGARMYRTGDLAKRLEGGDIEYLGRIDDQVKIRGFRIELGEIESALSQHPSVREAVVIAREDVAGEKRLVAYLIARGKAPGVSALRDHLSKTLPNYMVPAAFVFLERLPLTNNGKVDRKALPLPEEQRPELQTQYAVAETPVQERLAAIWAKNLHLDSVGIHDNFFELGGDSILSIQVITAARREGIHLTPKLLFTHQTIKKLAAVVGITEDTRLPHRAVNGDVPLTPIQHWFFEQKLAQAHHYNQALVLEVRESMERPLLEGALTELNRQHDSLRLRYVCEPAGWRQFYSSALQAAPLNWVNLAQFAEEDRRKSVEAIAAESQASLNSESGPLWQATYFELEPNCRDRLLLVVHHLAVDGVSWHSLLEDLETAYYQLKAGQAVHLPAKTSSFQEWAQKLSELAGAGSLRKELPFWQSITSRESATEANRAFPPIKGTITDTEGQARTLEVVLTAHETQSLLQGIPAVYNTQINDVLLTALTRAWNLWSGNRVLFSNLEGHGREHLFDDVDLSRTVGWFTSIFPVQLELPESGTDWRPGEALMAIKEQLRRVPQHGIGYGILRYLDEDSGLGARPEPSIVFNYLGQFGHALAGSKLFRFAGEATGPWHGPAQTRRHKLELNCLVMSDHMEFAWTYNPKVLPETSIQKLADEFLFALREVIDHCESAATYGRTPSDFPLARLDQGALDRLRPDYRNIEDIYPLSPIQTLFFSSSTGQTEFDQWNCTLHGDLDVATFQRAWLETVRRHAILRTTIHGEGLEEPVQIVHRDVRLPWTIEDWWNSPEQQAERWSSFLKQDRARPLVLSEAPAMRFALVRLSEDRWKFMWSLPPLLLDGWSWPIVFHDASQLYETFAQGLPEHMNPVHSYGEYVEWLSARSSDQAHEFWRQNLAGFREPTVLPSELAVAGDEAYQRHSLELSQDAVQALNTLARGLQLTLNTLIQGAWAILLSRQTGKEDIVFGAAYSGRPTELAGAESIIGPFVNNLPVRARVNPGMIVAEFLRDLHVRSLELNSFQFTSLLEIQSCSEVPWRHRIFDNLVVFQNYLVGESSSRFGANTKITDFEGPIHTNYPVLLLAEPGAGLRLTLIFEAKTVAAAAVERWGRDLVLLSELLPAVVEKRVSELQALLSLPVATNPTKRRLRGEAQNFIPPQTEIEQAVASVWHRLFGFERISVEENFFDVGGHSLLLLQLHRLLKIELKTDFPIVKLLEYPSVQSFAAFMDSLKHPAKDDARDLNDRAQRQKQARERMRPTLKR